MKIKYNTRWVGGEEYQTAIVTIKNKTYVFDYCWGAWDCPTAMTKELKDKIINKLNKR